MRKTTKKLLLATVAALATTHVYADNYSSPEKFLKEIYDFFADEPKPIINKWVPVKIKNIKAINASDNVNIKIDPNSKEDLIIHIPATAYSIDNGTLNLHMNSLCKEKYNVILKNIDNIENIEMKGNSVLFGKGLKKTKKPLSITSRDSARIEIGGMINVKSLTQHSKKKTEITWVDSKNLSIDAAAGELKLAGAADKANIWTHGSANVEAPHLRTKSTWISAEQHSHIYSNPIGYFYAHARGNSLIEHRGNYKGITLITKNLGNVIYRRLV